VPNFRTIRLLTQTLAQRAQSHLLIGAPERAFPDLAMVGQLSRLFERNSARKANNLVSVMLETAVLGRYTDVVAEGLKFHVWREEQLIAIQNQLADCDLLPLLADGLRTERAATCEMIEALLSPPGNRAPANESVKDFLQKAGSHSSWMPEGWVYENLAQVA